MNIYFTLIILFVLSLNHSTAESLFVNAIRFKGNSEHHQFNGLDFSIKFQDGNFKISKHKEGSKEFLIQRKGDSIQDLVFSIDHSAIAAVMCATDPKNRRRVIISIDAHGKQRAFEYKAYNMTERLGWVVELGGVSDGGNYLLAKCALMLPEDEGGVRHVRHEWTILEIKTNSISVVNSANAIDEWHKYARILAE